MKDIFNIDNLTDIPKELAEQLSVSTIDRFTGELLELFTIAKKDCLSIDEVTVAYYRKYNKVKSRKAILMKLYNMSRAKKTPLITVKGKKGAYKLKRGKDNAE